MFYAYFCLKSLLSDSSGSDFSALFDNDFDTF